jgi:diaminopimelate epimerase
VKQIFCKYEGTGNDFILIDNRRKIFPSVSSEFIAHLCHRKFGIGADGLILLEEEPGFDFKMVYFNSDGLESSMCGNGGRCLAAFAHHLNISSQEGEFIAVDGPHPFKIIESTEQAANVALKMKDVNEIMQEEKDYILNTGSPHFIRFVDEVENINVFEEGRKIRYSERFAEKGINVNFVSISDGIIRMRTYERGVENETLSCGTGVTAAALVSAYSAKILSGGALPVKTPGGELSVEFSRENEGFTEVWLTGPVKLVFRGEFILP